MKLPVNTYDQIAHGDVSVFYCAAPRGRLGWAMCDQTRVFRKGFSLSPNYSDHGCKVFVGNRAKSLQVALEWASERYKVKEWRRNGMGDYIDASKDYKPLQCEQDRADARLAARAAKRLAVR